MQRVRWFSPMPPAKSGIAHYSSMLVPALRQHVDVDIDVILSAAKEPPIGRSFAVSAAQDDAGPAIYHLGNNPFHEEIYRAAMREPGIAVLHDVVLHHLIVEMTLARGDVEGYVAALRASHGDAGEAWARGRAAGMHAEIGNFLLPASIELAQRSRAVIVHNKWAAERLPSFGVETPVFVVPHPFVHEEARKKIDRPAGRVIGFFGFLTAAKRADVVIEAFRRARTRNESLTLLVVGEPAPNIDIEKMRGDGIVFTGYVADEDFASYYSAADRFVNLRYPSAGETSGTLIRALDAGKPVAVSDYAQFSEFPDDCVTKIALDDDEVNKLTDFMLCDFDVEALASRQREWLAANCSLERAVNGYLDVIRNNAVPFAAAQARRTIPLFPRLAVAGSDESSVTLRNVGDVPLLARLYGQPGYRLIANGEWLDLPGDLQPGASVRIELPRMHGVVRLAHAIQGIPMIEAEPFAEVHLGAVR